MDHNSDEMFSRFMDEMMRRMLYRKVEGLRKMTIAARIEERKGVREAITHAEKHWEFIEGLYKGEEKKKYGDLKWKK